MSLIGIDLGNESCHIAVIRDGGLEIITSDTGQRMIPSYISFGEKSRCFGSQAKSSHVTNVKNTVFNFKRLIGGSYNSPFIQNEKTYLPYPICEHEKRIGLKVNYQGASKVFFVEQVVAMLLVKLKETAETYLGTEVVGCTLSVPAYFSNSARQAMLDAAQIANLNVLKLMNETAAVALSYGFYKSDLPQDKHIVVVFVDMGHSALQVSACSVSRGKVTVLATATNDEVGGRDFDIALARHFVEEFRTKYGVAALTNERAIIRLSSECEKLKKQLSANPQSLPLNIECFMNDTDVHSNLDRQGMETICKDLLLKAECTLKRVLYEAKLHPSDVQCVELVGGSTRIPAIKRLVQKVFCSDPQTTLNLDEAVARGCALQCAILSPNIKVRDYFVTDVQLFPIKLSWERAKEGGEAEVFPAGHPIPFSKYLTFFLTEDFTIHASYGVAKEATSPDTQISSYTIRNISCAKSDESAKIAVKVRVNIHGIFCLTSALLLPKGSEEVERINQRGEDFMDLTGKIQNYKMPVPTRNPKHVELPIDSVVQGMTCQELSKCAAEELKMALLDKQEIERIDAQNSLEECIYSLRCALSTELEPFISKQVCDDFMQRLQKEETWLYENGQESNKEDFSKVQSELKALAEPLYFRKKEYENRFDAINCFRDEIKKISSVIERYKNGDRSLSHLSAKEVDKARKLVNQKSEWLDNQIVLLSEANLHDTPPVFLKTILDEKAALINGVNSLMKKSK